MKQIIKDATQIWAARSRFVSAVLLVAFSQDTTTPWSPPAAAERDVATCQRSNLTHWVERGRLWQPPDEPIDATANWQLARKTHLECGKRNDAQMLFTVRLLQQSVYKIFYWYTHFAGIGYLAALHKDSLVSDAFPILATRRTKSLCPKDWHAHGCSCNDRVGPHEICGSPSLCPQSLLALSLCLKSSLKLSLCPKSSL